jgi:hypothetical protein
MNTTYQNNDVNTVIITIKILACTNARGTRMKISHGNKPGAVTIDYHSVNGFEEAAVNFVRESYKIGNPIRTNWVYISRDTVAVALVY